jgi:hypothetical protein
MNFLDILSAALSILGVYTIVIYAPYLLPRNLVPHVSAALSEVKGLLDQAEASGAITDDASEYRANLTMYDVSSVAVVVVPSLADLPSSQACESASTDAGRKPTFSWDIPAARAHRSVLFDVQALHPLVAGRRHEDQSRGSFVYSFQPILRLMTRTAS